MLELIAAIKKDLSENKVEEAIQKLKSIDERFYIYMAKQFRAVRNEYYEERIELVEFKRGISRIMSKILAELKSKELNFNSTKAANPTESEKGASLTGQEQENISSETFQAVNTLDSMDEAKDRLEELSIHLEFFDWSQRDYLGELGALLLKVDQELSLLPRKNQSFPSQDSVFPLENQVKHLLRSIAEQNNKTRGKIFEILTYDGSKNSKADLERLLTRTKNIDLPKLASQLETLAYRLNSDF